MPCAMTMPNPASVPEPAEPASPAAPDGFVPYVDVPKPKPDRRSFLRLGSAARAGGAHETLTVITRIRDRGDRDHVDELRTLLKQIDDDVCREGECPLPGLGGTIHTVRWTILPRAVRGSGVTVDETLVFWTVFDGTLEDHLKALTSGAALQRLDEIYRHCEGYSAGELNTLAAYLQRHTRTQGPIACFDGTPGRSVKQIEDEQQLHIRLRDEFLDKRDWGDTSHSHIYLEAKKWVASPNNDLQWALRAPEIDKPQSLQRPLWATLGVFLALCGVLGVLPVLLATAIVLGVAVVISAAFVWALSRAEARAQRNFVPASRKWFAEHDDKIKLRENEQSGINRLTILTDVHPGFVRALTIRLVLWVVNFRAGRTVDGKLQGVETIHFAQWRLVDGGRRLLFMSNYDHRWDDYFRAFSDNAAPGVNAIWSNTVGFPPTFLLIAGGSRDLPQFQASARAYQIPTDVWWVGYKKRDFTTRRINENTRIREGLSRCLTPPEVKEWLELVYADAS